ncbi:MAG: hypothetical protein JWM36_2186 [Hyphomicrobiales bacterium]|nr:hypothetical protein [Hyphomicrobiales bacterium]
MKASELSVVTETAREVEGLVSRIVEALREQPAPTVRMRLLALLQKAEEFFLQSGSKVCNARFEAIPDQQEATRFMSALPTWIRMVRDAKVADIDTRREAPIRFSAPAFNRAVDARRAG